MVGNVPGPGTKSTDCRRMGRFPAKDLEVSCKCTNFAVMNMKRREKFADLLLDIAKYSASRLGLN